MELNDITSIDNLFQAFDEFYSTPKRPPLTGAQQNVIAKKMLHFKKKTISFGGSQVVTINHSDYSALVGPDIFQIKCWVVQDDLPDYNESDKSTWVFKPLDIVPTHTIDNNNNPLVYTIDFGYVPTHGFFQLF